MCHQFYCIAEGQVGLYIKALGDKGAMNLVKVNGQGEYFGTYNLIQNSPQTMQSVCESLQVTLIEISKDFFDKELKENEEKIIALGINQFKKMPLFKNHPYYILKNIYLSSFEVKLIKNNFVFKENDDIHAIYVIKKGEFSLSVMVEGQIFGEEDLVQGKKSRSYTAICDSSDGELYVIRSQVFLQKIYNNNFSKKTIQELLKQKNLLFDERMSQVQTQYIEKQSPLFIRTQPDLEGCEKQVVPIIPSFAAIESNNQKQQEKMQFNNMNRMQKPQFNSPVKVTGEYDRILERRLSPFKQLESSLFGNKEEQIYESRSLDNKQLKIIGTSPQQQLPPTPQSDMFSIEIDEKQKILLKQKQQQHYVYQNYLKKCDGNKSDKLDELLKKTGYKRIDRHTVEKQSGNEYDFIKIRPSLRLQSLDKKFQYFYGPELQHQHQQQQQIQQQYVTDNSHLTLSSGSSGQRVSNLSIRNGQFQIRQNQNNNADQSASDYLQYQNQMKNFQEEGETPKYSNNNEEQQLNFQLNQNEINLNNINQQYQIDQQQQANDYMQNNCGVQLQQGQLIHQDNYQYNHYNQFILAIDPQYEGEIHLSTLFQNEMLKNKNMVTSENHNNNYVITEIEEEDRLSTDQSRQRKLKTESFSSNQQDYLFQSSTRQNTLSPSRGEKSVLFDKFDFTQLDKEDLILFRKKAQTMKKIKDTQFYSDQSDHQTFNVNKSFNTVDNNQLLKYKWKEQDKRSQSTRKNRTPQKNNLKQPNSIYNKDYINQQLDKFTLSNHQKNNESNSIFPNLADSFKQNNGYRLPSMSQGQSRKNSPPLSPLSKSRDEQRMICSRQDQKKNIFLKLNLNSYEQKLNGNLNDSIRIKTLKSTANTPYHSGTNKLLN